MKAFDDLAIVGLEGKVHAGHWSISLVDKQLIGIEEATAFDKNIRHAERSKHRTIETFARFHIRHSEMYVIDESAAVELHQRLLAV